MEDSGIQSSHRNTTGIISTGEMGSLGKDGAEGTISLAAILDYEGHHLRFLPNISTQANLSITCNILRRHCSFAAILRYGVRIELSACHAIMYHPYVKRPISESKSYVKEAHCESEKQV
jgi:hypothetical protein